MAFLYGRAGRLTAKTAISGPTGQDDVLFGQYEDHLDAAPGVPFVQSTDGGRSWGLAQSVNKSYSPAYGEQALIGHGRRPAGGRAWCSRSFCAITWRSPRSSILNEASGV